MQFNQARVIGFVDGFNLYHALNNIKKSYFKWLNLKSLINVFLKSKSEKLDDVYYFAAKANHTNKSTQEPELLPMDKSRGF
jgi:hypothetical protein